jgi:nicotinamidase-related amidase
MTYLLIAGGLVLAGLGYTAWGIRRMTTATRGARIDAASRLATALLVIDMQEDFTRPQPGRDWSEEGLQAAIARIRQLSEEAAARGEPVIVIRHVMKGWWANRLNGWFNKGLGNAGSAGLGLDPRLQIRASGEFVKHIGDAFSNPGLEAYLGRHGIGRLRITGLDGCHCVRNTTGGALNRGYRVELMTDAVLAADQAGWDKVRKALQQEGASLHPA